MTRQTAIKYVLLISLYFLTSAQLAFASGELYNGKTIIYFDKFHGVQIEYYSFAGKLYLWYPGNKTSLPGNWKIKNNSKICFRYGANTYNPVTKSRGSKWRCNNIKKHRKRIKYTCVGDVYDLSSGKLPFVLARNGFRANFV